MKTLGLYILLIFVTNSIGLELGSGMDNAYKKIMEDKKDGKEKIIIDTDGGVDDAMALMMALADPHLDLLAITTTVGNTNLSQVVINVLKTRRVMNSTVPVYPGSHSPLVFLPKSDYFYGEDGFGDVPDPNPPSIEEAEKEHAVLAMIRLVKKYPKEITIISIGPLTNLAMAMRMDKDFKKNTKQIVWIGGSTKGVGNMSPGLEFNAFFDPPANFICFNETGPPIIMVPWELVFITTEIPVEWRKNVLGKVKSPQVDFLNKIEEKSFAHGYWSPADSKTVAIVINPSIIKKQSLHFVEFVWEGDKTRGLTLVDYAKFTGKEPNAIIIEDMDVEAYKKMCLEYLSADIPERE